MRAEDAMAAERKTSGDSIPPDCERIEIHVSELRQLFNAIDPSPFRERDLAPEAEEFIVGWARDAPKGAPLALVVDLDRPAGIPDEAAILRDAVHDFFRHRSDSSRRKLRQLLRIGRISLVIGVAFLGLSIAASNFLLKVVRAELSAIVKESLVIGGWVAMWRPMEIFLYDWWPIRAERKLYDRLSVMPVRIAYLRDGGAEWRRDWPAVKAAPAPAPAAEAPTTA
jgi:hypothetical protein